MNLICPELNQDTCFILYDQRVKKKKVNGVSASLAARC